MLLFFIPHASTVLVLAFSQAQIVFETKGICATWMLAMRFLVCIIIVFLTALGGSLGKQHQYATNKRKVNYVCSGNAVCLAIYMHVLFS